MGHKHRTIAEQPPDYEALFRGAPSPLLVLRPAPAFTVVEASDEYLRNARTTRQAIVGRNFFELFPEAAESGAQLSVAGMRASLERVLTTGLPDRRNSPIVAPDGSLRYIVHNAQDNSPMEMEVLRCARERDDTIRRLESANEELQAFTHSASYDLRAPLRAIESLCRLLAERHAGGLDAEACTCLARIDSTARRMSSTVDGLLALAAIASSPMSRKRLDLGAIARRVIAELKVRDPRRDVTVEIAGGMFVWADEPLLDILLDNLIGNAWKYTSRRDDAHIEVGVRAFVGRSVFYVRDNGAGFDMARADKLFTPFFRLHCNSEFEGHGIGLATVKRIVERHGGEIWAEARPDHGATIHFTLNDAAHRGSETGSWPAAPCPR